MIDKKIYDVAVLGAGAAGLFIAGDLSRAGLSCALIEHNKEPGKKILISGGGRANFTNKEVASRHFYSESKNFAKSALKTLSSQDFVQEVIEAHNVEYFEKTLGQLFCKRSAKDLVAALLARFDQKQVDSLYAQEVLSAESNGDLFFIHCQHKASGEKSTIRSRKLVVATGGLSIPKIGATSIGYKIAKDFGHSITPLHPALDGFVLSDEGPSSFSELSGLSVNATLSTQNGPSFTENVLFTHKGLSGPAALKSSLYWQHGEELRIDWLAGQNFREMLASVVPSTLLKTLLQPLFPKRLLDHFSKLSEDFQQALAMPVGSLGKKRIHFLEEFLTRALIRPKRTVGYNKAEVTRGGIQCSEIKASTMESKLCEGLYFIGEVVDVTGWLGGYNFHWAWASARSASNALTRSP